MMSPDPLVFTPGLDIEIVKGMVAIIVALLTAGGFWEWRKVRRKPKVSAAQAEEAAVAKDSVMYDKVMQSALEIQERYAKMAEQERTERIKDNERFEARLQKDHETFEGKISALTARLDHVESESREAKRLNYVFTSSLERVHSWWEDMDRNWARVSTGPRMPPLPYLASDNEMRKN